ncbi:uncharacterized protein lekr1 [Xenentodon cancila]
MERSETVCCYCGVSYLIFHEFHQLQTRLAQLEAELQLLRETAQKEKTRRDALEQGRLEWEKELHLQVQREAEVKEKNTRKELEERNRNMARTLREEFEAKYRDKKREVEKEYQKIFEEKERQLRRDLEEWETVTVENLEKQREELKRRAEEREKVVSDALQKTNKSLEELRTNLQQLEKRLVIADGAKAEAQQELEKEKQHVEILRSVRARQQQALRATLSLLRSSGSGLADVQGLLSQLKRAWQALRFQILQHTMQVFSALSEELQRSTAELHKIKEDKERLTQQLMEQKSQREEQLSRQEDSEKEHREKLLRLKVELEEKHEMCLLCQQRCEAQQKQLSSWEQRQEQTNQKYCAAVEEVTQLRKRLDESQQEKRELMVERDTLIESHDKVLTKMKEDNSQQLNTKLAAALEEHRSHIALHLRKQREELRREAELELKLEKEKNQMLLLQCQQGHLRIQQKWEERELEVRDLQEELHQERRRGKQRRTRDEQRWRREEEMHQQEAQELSQAKAEVQQMKEKNAELIEEVALLQETVRRECEEREELTAALFQARQELCGQGSVASHQHSSGNAQELMDRQTQSINNFHLHSQSRVPLTRSSSSPNTLRTFPACTDKDKGLDEEGGRAGGLESWNSAGALGGASFPSNMAAPRMKKTGFKAGLHTPMRHVT